MFRTTAYWSGETLAKRLPELITPYDEACIDCAAYLLSIGNEIYVSPTAGASDPEVKSIDKLTPGKAFAIPPGQFAFLTTAEYIRVPADAIAFISIRAKTKFKGLVNISGFHVDPGYEGCLVFSVFNAGPVSIHLKQGQPIFLIWYADLDRSSKKIRKEPPRKGLDPDLIQGISGDIQSLSNLNEKIKEVDVRLSESLAKTDTSLQDRVRDLQTELTTRVHNVEREQTYYRLIGALVLAVLIAVVGTWIKSAIDERFGPQSRQTEARP